MKSKLKALLSKLKDKRHEDRQTVKEYGGRFAVVEGRIDVYDEIIPIIEKIIDDEK
jgi:hypothetical protein